MKVYLAGEDITVTIPLTRNGEPFVPDDGTVHREIRGHNGSVLSPKSAISGIADSAVNVPVEAVHNALALPDSSEKRVIIITGAVGGHQFRIQHAYRLIPYLNFTADAADVRTFLGISDGELPDDEVDLVAAFFDVTEVVPYEALNAALSGVDRLERAANRAIVAQAVLNLMPSLPARISKSETDGTSRADRFEIDFAALERKAHNQLNRAIETITGLTPPARTLIAVTERTDPLTGA